MNRRAGHSLIGIDVGARTIAAVQLDGRGRIAAAAQIDRRTEPAAPLSAEEAATLDEVLYRQGFNGRDLVVGVPDDKLFTQVLELPPRSSGAPVEQLARMEVARAHKCGPDTFEMACWDLPAPVRAGDATHVMAAACGHADADALLDALESTGLSVKALDARPWAVARACRAAGAADSIAAALDLGDYAAVLTVLCTGTVVYQRVMREAGLCHLRERIREAVDVAPEVAEYLLKRVADPEPGAGSLPEEGPERKAEAILEDHLGTLASEVQIALEYVGHRYPGQMGRLVAVGPGAAHRVVVAGLAAKLGVEVKAVAPADAAPCCESAAAASRNPALTVALGLAQWGRAA